MLKLHDFISKVILEIIDWFYPIFKKMMPLKTFRYAACGGANTVLDISLFFLAYNYILDRQIIDLGFISISPHIASFIISFCITFPIGFYLSRYVVFQETTVTKRKQLMKYFVAGKVEAGKCQRVEQQIRAVVAVNAGQAVGEGGANIPLLVRRRH